MHCEDAKEAIVKGKISTLMSELEVCGYTRTREFTRTRPVPAGRVRSGRRFTGLIGYGKVITGTSVPGFTRPNP